MEGVGKAPEAPLIERCIEFLSKRVKQEQTNIRKLLHVGLSAFTDRPLNAALVAKSSEGKTYLATRVFALFPAENVVMLRSISPKTLFYERGELALFDPGAPEKERYKTHYKGKPLSVYMDNLKANADEAKKKGDQDLVASYYEEISELRARTFHLVDLRNKIIIFLEEPPVEVWRELLPVLSHDSYWTVSKAVVGEGNKFTRSVVFQGWPTVVYCTSRTDSTFGWDDLQTRFEILEPTQTTVKYIESLKLSYADIFNVVPGEDPQKTPLMEEVRALCERVGSGSFRVYLPYDPDVLVDIFKGWTEGTVMRKAVNVGLHLNLEVLWHLGDRISLRIMPDGAKSGTEYLVAHRQDAEMTATLYLRSIDLLAQMFGVPPLEMELYYNILLPNYENRDDQEGWSITVDTTAAAIDIYKNAATPGGANQQSKLKTNKRTVRRYLDVLSEAGLVDKVTLEEDGKKRKGRGGAKVYIPRLSREDVAIAPTNIKDNIMDTLRTLAPSFTTLSRFDPFTHVRIPSRLASRVMNSPPDEILWTLDGEKEEGEKGAERPETSNGDLEPLHYIRNLPQIIGRFTGGLEQAKYISSDIGLDLKIDVLTSHIERDSLFSSLMVIGGYKHRTVHNSVHNDVLNNLHNNGDNNNGKQSHATVGSVTGDPVYFPASGVHNTSSDWFSPSPSDKTPPTFSGGAGEGEQPRPAGSALQMLRVLMDIPAFEWKNGTLSLAKEDVIGVDPELADLLVSRGVAERIRYGE